MSAKVSIALSQRLFPRAINQAIGMPASRSNAATERAITKLFSIAPKARLMSDGWSRMNCMLSHLMKIPTMGGRRINAKKTITAEA